ncbi:cytochrome P450, putative [Ricinus communis]|uniref:Cytochrome P450, putative n=3 Tax=Ricinus communis TaxID=3988 RepID=B9SZS2_RICCO|nr:cytochrome P450, putative [Ricinus communis]
MKLFKSFPRFKVFIMMPRLGKFLFKKLWKELNEIVTGFDDCIKPLIWLRKKDLEQEISRTDQDCTFYVDTLLNLQVPGEEGKITDAEVLGLCNEFIAAGTDTTMLSLEWIMANLVKYPTIQARILEEIKAVTGDEGECIKEEDLQKMPYLKAVILEGLRRHPPGYALATPHAVTEDIELGGYTVPKGTAANFLIADMGRDPNIWDDPMEFKPERFSRNEAQDFDVTGIREIKMMPFGAGRRICPGYGLAMLHLEYLVANLVWQFEWRPVNGEDVDLTEKYGITISMKNPLRVLLSPRF